MAIISAREQSFNEGKSYKNFSHIKNLKINQNPYDKVIQLKNVVLLSDLISDLTCCQNLILLGIALRKGKDKKI